MVAVLERDNHAMRTYKATWMVGWVSHGNKCCQATAVMAGVNWGSHARRPLKATGMAVECSPLPFYSK